MKSKIDTPTVVQKQVMELIEGFPRYNDVLPKRFISLMENNHATTDETDADGNSLRSPLIVALGDSVTAGWFEGNTRFSKEIQERFFFQAMPVDHITDVANVYHEQLRLMLADHFERSSISVINSGISGDTVAGMLKRLHRDVLRYDPNLVLLHASLNGPEDVNAYAQDLEEIIVRIQRDTDAEIVIITPNLMAEEVMGTLDARAEIMLNFAEKYRLSVADQYKKWKCIKENGIDICHLLSNELNHPTVFGHYIIALELMKLFNADGS